MNVDRSTAFAGDLFLTLAAEGRLRMEPDQADQLIARLEETLGKLRTRLRMVRTWQGSHPRWLISDLPRHLAPAAVDALFVDQCNPGLLERAIEEFPKYIDALRQARGDDVENG